MSTKMQQPVVVVDSLFKRHEERAVVSGIDLLIEHGQVFGLLGPNGAGKTTTVEILAGLRRPSEGKVRVFGLDPVSDRDRLTLLVSVQPQAAHLFPTLTVTETLDLFRSFYMQPRTTAEVLNLVGLADSSQIRVKKLSGGQLRRLLIGAAVIGRPQLVILDEPSAGLDPVARRELWNLIRSLRSESVTVLLTTHHMEEAMELCDQLAIMVAGRIVAQGTPDQLVAEHTSTSTVRFLVPEDTDPNVILDVSEGQKMEFGPVPGAILVKIDTEDPDVLLRRVTFQRGLGASGIRVETASLEDVFLKLAGERIGEWSSPESESQR